MEILLLAIVVVLCTGLIMIMLYRLYFEVKKSNKDQQEIKTRLHWIKERQKK